jgi:hypothetical protein
MPQGGLAALEAAKTKDEILSLKAFQYDLVCNGYELASGSIRNHLPEAMIKAFGNTGVTADEVQARFGGMYRAFQYGAPPHGGMAAGIDRIVMLLVGAKNLREVTLYAVPDESAGRRPADGRAERGHAEATQGAAPAHRRSRARALKTLLLRSRKVCLAQARLSGSFPGAVFIRARWQCS